MNKYTSLITILFLLNSCSTKNEKPRNANNNTINKIEYHKGKELGFIGESENFLFYNHFWLNMHHFLYNKARESSRSNIEKTIAPEGWNKMNKNERFCFKKSLRFYSENIIVEDLRRGAYNSKFKKWVVEQGMGNLHSNDELFVKHSKQLNNFKNVYEKYYWKTHLESNNAAFRKNIDLIRKYEADFVEKLVRLCKANWQSDPIRVDISYHSKRDIPYTTTHPTTHIVMDSRNTPHHKGIWFELLLHESSHHLMSNSSGFVGGTISNVAEVLNNKIDEQLWHGYLFYFSGKVAKECLSAEGINDYEMYMKNNIFFSSMFETLDKYLPQYMETSASLADVSKKIIQELNYKE